jgi:hypothetical protein
MSQSIDFEFHGRKETLDIIDTGKEIVEYLSSQSYECPLIGSKIEMVNQMGQGEGAKVFLIRTDLGTKEYVAKKIETNAVEREINLESKHSLQDLSDKLMKEEGISSKITITINGGNPKKMFIGEVSLLIPYYAGLCLTEGTRSYKRTDGNKKNVTFSAGSYICRKTQYSDYMIGILCGELYRKGISVNFLNTFGFATCPSTEMKHGILEVSQYIFMEKISTNVGKSIKCLMDLQGKHDHILDSLIIQILHAIFTYQTYYQLQHGDLHSQNVFLDQIDNETSFRGEKLMEYDWFHYRVKETDLYIPYTPFIVKIADFDRSVKYSQPVIACSRVLEGDYRPNWYTRNYDSLYVLSVMSLASEHVEKILYRVLKVRNKEEFEKKYLDPSLYFALKLDILDKLPKSTYPEEILQNKEIFGRYMNRPSFGKIATLGEI